VVVRTSSAGQVKAATAVERSDNPKLGAGRCSATYVAQHSCPKSCPFFGKGCYAESGPMLWSTRRLNKSTITDPVRIARQEARAIDGLTGKRPLRLHVVGDSKTRRGTRLLAAAAGRYTERGGGRVWTYTHAWRKVPRTDWGTVSVLASCETARDVRTAHRAGYAAALVVAAHRAGYAAALVVAAHPADGRAHALDGAKGFKVIPCPNQTRGVTCADCKLCFDSDRLHANKLVIGFSAHGGGAGKVRIALEVLK
jgi:hypothetical protein